MKKNLLLLLFGFLGMKNISHAQQVYVVKADSVKITDCDSSELIIENHTRDVSGFLFNIGKGRTAFEKGMQKLSDSLYLIGADTLKIPMAWRPGGNVMESIGVLGTQDANHLDFYTNGFRQARLTAAGTFLLDTVNDNYYRLDVIGDTRVLGTSTVGTGGDNYDIQCNPASINGYSTGVNGSMITFGDTIASIGVNRQTLGNIPANSMIIGGTGPGSVTTTIDYNRSPSLMIDGDGAVTINGGWHGVGTGASIGISTNANGYAFYLNGCRGTGTGTPGDIVFSTGIAQDSGTTIHTMTNRWRIKGGTGYFSNTTTATSNLDVSGANGYTQLRLRSSYTPTSTSDANGNVGDFCWDDQYFYVKTASGWKRAALTTY